MGGHWRGGSGRGEWGGRRGGRFPGVYAGAWSTPQCLTLPDHRRLFQCCGFCARARCAPCVRAPPHGHRALQALHVCGAGRPFRTRHDRQRLRHMIDRGQPRPVRHEKRHVVLARGGRKGRPGPGDVARLVGHGGVGQHVLGPEAGPHAPLARLRAALGVPEGPFRAQLFPPEHAGRLRR